MRWHAATEAGWSIARQVRPGQSSPAGAWPVEICRSVASTAQAGPDFAGCASRSFSARTESFSVRFVHEFGGPAAVMLALPAPRQGSAKSAAAAPGGAHGSGRVRQNRPPCGLARRSGGGNIARAAARHRGMRRPFQRSRHGGKFTDVRPEPLKRPRRNGPDSVDPQAAFGPKASGTGAIRRKISPWRPRPSCPCRCSRTSDVARQASKPVLAVSGFALPIRGPRGRPDLPGKAFVDSHKAAPRFCQWASGFIWLGKRACHGTQKGTIDFVGAGPFAACGFLGHLI